MTTMKTNPKEKTSKQKFVQIPLVYVDYLTEITGEFNVSAIYLLSQINYQYKFAEKNFALKQNYLIINYDNYTQLGLSSHQVKRLITFLESVGLVKKHIFRTGMSGKRGTFLGVIPRDLESEITLTHSAESLSDNLNHSAESHYPLVRNHPNKVLEVNNNLHISSSKQTTTEKTQEFSLIEEAFIINAERCNKILRKNFMSNFDTKLLPKIKQNSLPLILECISYYLHNPSNNPQLDHPNPSVDSFVQWYSEIFKEYRNKAGQYSEDAMTFHNLSR